MYIQQHAWGVCIKINVFLAEHRKTEENRRWLARVHIDKKLSLRNEAVDKSPKNKKWHV